MDEEEEKAQKLARYVIGQDLSLLSVEEVGEMITGLKQEIIRLEEAKTAKSEHLSAAQALFKS